MNEEMTRKMNEKSFPGIRDLDKGKSVDEGQIIELCDFIDSRFDCADFRVVTILRTLYAYRDLLSDGTVARIRKTVLHFKYWMDEPEIDTMCYWSENHQIIFHSCEYLAGQYYPDAIFTNTGMTGREHMEKARLKVLRWLKYRWEYGFSEFHSNIYYEEDIAPLANIVDFSQDEEMVAKTKIIMDILFLDMALHSYRGLFAAASGRCYEEQKTDPRQQFTLDMSEKLSGYGNIKKYDYTRLSANFILCKNYRIPAVIREIARDEGEVAVRDSMGLDLSEIKHEFEDPKDIDTTGMFLWAMEAFTNPEAIGMALTVFNAWQLQSNGFLKDLKMVNIPILRGLHLLPLIVRLLRPATNGIAIQRADTYTCKTAHYMMSTAQAHHPGFFADQQHIWQLTLSPDVSVFTTHPACEFFDDQARNFSPSYWVGSGRLPHSFQHKNIHISIYRTKGRKGFLERTLNRFTHAWFPAGKFDEVVHHGRYVFGRLGDTYVALIGRYPLQFAEGSGSDLLQRGKVTYWICEVGKCYRPGDFPDFIHDIESRWIDFDGRSLAYQTRTGEIRLRYKGRARVNKRIVDTRYPRLDTPYVKAPRKPEELDIRHNGKRLYLHFDQMKREVR